MRLQIGSGGSHKKTGGGWREGAEGKAGEEGWKMLFNCASPVARLAAAVSIERTVARLKNERSNRSGAR